MLQVPACSAALAGIDTHDAVTCRSQVVKNDHQRRGLSFTPRGSQIGAEYEVTTLIEDDEEEDVAAGSPSAKQIRQSLQAAATNEDELRSIFDVRRLLFFV